MTTRVDDWEELVGGPLRGRRPSRVVGMAVVLASAVVLVTFVRFASGPSSSGPSSSESRPSVVSESGGDGARAALPDSVDESIRSDAEWAGEWSGVGTIEGADGPLGECRLEIVFGARSNESSTSLPPAIEFQGTTPFGALAGRGSHAPRGPTGGSIVRASARHGDREYRVELSRDPGTDELFGIVVAVDSEPPASPHATVRLRHDPRAETLVLIYASHGDAWRRVEIELERTVRRGDSATPR